MRRAVQHTAKSHCQHETDSPHREDLTVNAAFCINNGDFVLQMVNSVFKMMDSLQQKVLDVDKEPISGMEFIISNTEFITFKT